MSELLLSIINFLTSTMTGITGLGGGMILAGVMPMFLPTVAIIPVHGATQLASNASRAWFGRRHVDMTYIKPYLIGTLIGAVVFGILVRFIKLDLIPLLIGFYILLTQWSHKFNELLKSFENFGVIGFLQTGIGLFVGAPGPMHMPLLIKKYNDNHVVVSTASAMISIVHLIKLNVCVDGLCVYGLLAGNRDDDHRRHHRLMGGHQAAPPHAHAMAKAHPTLATDHHRDQNHR